MSRVPVALAVSCAAAVSVGVLLRVFNPDPPAKTAVLSEAPTENADNECSEPLAEEELAALVAEHFRVTPDETGMPDPHSLCPENLRAKQFATGIVSSVTDGVLVLSPDKGDAPMTFDISPAFSFLNPHEIDRDKLKAGVKVKVTYFDREPGQPLHCTDIDILDS